MTQLNEEEKSHDFIIVVSGVGGGPLAANLALAGFSVLLIETGGDKINDNYSVPAYHALSTEDPQYSWEFFVKHYSDDYNPRRDPKYHPQTNEKNSPRYPGIFYPRASGIGGCTTHHAMIAVYSHESDWDNIADIAGADSWSAKNMRHYFDRIERSRYGEPGEPIVYFDQKEVTLCGGAFNTPQLLMLSGIGPKAELERPEIAVDVRVDSQGVGKNLQDRYEVGVIAKTSGAFYPCLCIHDQ